MNTVSVTAKEKNRLVKFGSKLGKAINEIVQPKRFLTRMALSRLVLGAG